MHLLVEKFAWNCGIAVRTAVVCLVGCVLGYVQLSVSGTVCIGKIKGKYSIRIIKLFIAYPCYRFVGEVVEC